MGRVRDMLLAVAMLVTATTGGAAETDRREGAPSDITAPVIPGHRAAWECRPGAAPDTLHVAWPHGPVRLLTGTATWDAGHMRSGPNGDTVVFVARRNTADAARDPDPGTAPRHCIVRYATPVLPATRARLYDPAAVPVLRPGDTAVPTSARAETFSAEPDTGGYELALSGSKSLAVSAGGGGAVGVDAALYLNLDGQIAENVWIEGRLSDQNTPVQPQGNTTTLREIDEKYLRVYGRRYEYLLGDQLMRHGREGEDRYVLQAEGARVRYGAGGRSGTASFVRSKGLYHSDTLRGVDGKQQGYYLRGRDGRTFITVLAGTERIWRNGVPLQRGVDYVIDYSQGRVDFLTPVWVTGENLFSAEFQYSEDTYPRLVVAGEAADTIGAFRLSVRAIQETEDENNPAAGFPDAATLQTYRDAGDAPVVDSVGAPVGMPARRAVTVVSGDWDGGEAGHARLSILGSVLDRNTYSPRDDDDNLGWSSRYRGIHRLGAPLDRGGVGRLTLEPDHEHRSRDYASFRQLIETRAFRDAWNLDAAVGERAFDANRLGIAYEPFTGVEAGVEAGYAEGTLGDTATAQSRRGGAFVALRGPSSGARVSVETLRARDPLRRDNDRIRAGADKQWRGWRLGADFRGDDWTAGRDGDTLARSRLLQPRVTVESPVLGDRWVWSPEADVLHGLSDYKGREDALRDSLVDAGLAQRLRLLGWGPVSGDLYAARRQQRVWRETEAGERALEAETAVYDQAEANVSVSDHLKGYGLNLHYRAARTAETPLVEAYEQVDSGRGDYAFDAGQNAYVPVETGGDYVFVGLVRDSLIGRQPYRDLQWNLHLELAPGRWPAPFLVTAGILRDLELALDMETDHQDSSGGALPLPRFTDAQIEAVRSGRARYEPSLRWTHPDGGRSATLRYRREYAKGAGVYAFRERVSESRAEYRLAWSLLWEAAWIGALESRWREALSGAAAGTRTDAQRAQMLIYRRLPREYTLVPSLEYRRVEGEDAGFPVELQAVVPRARVEKGAFFGGRASAEYGVHWLFGRGEGGYFVTEGFRRGVTHRFEAVAQSAVRTHLHLNASYLARLEPGAAAWTQRFSAEVRAVF